MNLWNNFINEKNLKLVVDYVCSDVIDKRMHCFVEYLYFHDDFFIVIINLLGDSLVLRYQRANFHANEPVTSTDADSGQAQPSHSSPSTRPENAVFLQFELEHMRWVYNTQDLQSQYRQVKVGYCWIKDYEKSCLLWRTEAPFLRKRTNRYRNAEIWVRSC